MQRRSWYPESPQACMDLADALVTLHFAIVLFVILGQVAILIGRFTSWRWVRHPWFRVPHLALIVFVALQALAGIPCPLTIWEQELRHLGGASIDDSGFVARWSRELLFIDASEAAFTVSYVAFALLVAASLILVPVRWRAWRGRERKTGDAC